MVNDKRCILVVDDEVKMVRAIKDFLNMRGFYVIEANDGQQAIEVYYQNNSKIDLILIDVMMPVYDGFEVLENLRLNNSCTPVIMLTAKAEEYDQLKGFNLGADDYIVKPFSPSLLMARIESVLNRTYGNEMVEVLFDDIYLNTKSRTGTLFGKDLVLKNREFDLIYFLITNKNQVFTRENLLTNVWGYDFDGDVRTVDTHIKQLRIKLAEKANYIKTIYKIGYKFEV